MSRAELDRLASDLVAHPALVERLAPSLQPGADPVAAAAAFRAAGYAIDAAELPGPHAAPRPLDEATLDRVAGGFMHLRTTVSPFEDGPGG